MQHNWVWSLNVCMLLFPSQSVQHNWVWSYFNDCMCTIILKGMMAEFPSNKTHTWAHIPLWPLLSIIYHFSGCPLLPGETVLGERGCRGKEERTEILGVWIGETINWKSQVVQVEGRNMRCYWERPRGRFRARQTENGISFCMALYPTLGFWNTLPIHCVPRPRSA